MQVNIFSNHDINLNTDQLEEKYSPEGGGEHPTFIRTD